ncbi:unnamed protein product [Urochloa humidicola]
MEKHFSDERRVLVSLPDYCRTFPAYQFLIVLGVPSGLRMQTRSVVRMLSLRTQASIRGMLCILDDLFASGQCLRKINEGTFVFNKRTGIPLLSRQGRRDIAPITDGTQVDRNGREMAILIRGSVLRSPPCTAVPVEEVEQGLLLLMQTQGRATWPVILNHPSLVPLENRLTLQSRLHQELFKILWRTHPGKCLRVLRQLLFPSDWHARAKRNTIMSDMYKGSAYNTWDISQDMQAWEILRFTRNGDQHGPDNAVGPGATAAAYRGLDIAVIFYSEFPLLLHSLVLGMFLEGQLGNVNIDSLFCYPPPPP